MACSLFRWESRKAAGKTGREANMDKSLYSSGHTRTHRHSVALCASVSNKKFYSHGFMGVHGISSRGPTPASIRVTHVGFFAAAEKPTARENKINVRQSLLSLFLQSEFEVATARSSSTHACKR